MKRRLLCLLLVLVMVLGLLPAATAEETNALRYRNLKWYEGDLWGEDETWQLQTLTPTALGQMGNTLHIRPYYNHTPLDCENGVLTVGNENLITVSKIGAEKTKDGKPFFEIRLIGVGSTALTYQNKQENQEYTVPVEIGLPDGYYGAQEMSADQLVSNNFCVGDYEYLWYITASGLTWEEAQTAVVSAKFTSQDASFDIPVEVKPFPKKENTDRYNLRIKMTTDSCDPRGHVQVQLFYQRNGWTYQARNLNGRFDRANVSAEVAGYTIAFGEYIPGYMDGSFGGSSNGTISNIYGANKGTEGFLTVQANVRGTDASGTIYYEEAPEGAVSLAIQRVWIEESPYFGKAELLSLAPGSTRVTELTEIQDERRPLQVNYYLLDGYQGVGQICAEVEVTVGNLTEIVTIKAAYRRRTSFEHTIEVEADADTAAVNSLLNTIAADAAMGHTYIVKLAANAQYETIVIPEQFQQYLLSLVIKGQDGTRVRSINLSNGYLRELSNIYFCAAEGYSSALYNGTCPEVYDCSFRDYEVAIDSTDKGYIMPRNCLFVGNQTALSVDIKDNKDVTSTHGGWDNQFVDNGTAILVKSLNDNLTPFKFRVENCNFLENGTDFDIQAPGRFYFYRNFYGKWANKHQHGYDELPYAVYAANNDKIVQYRAPKVKGQDSDTKIVTNFRWKHPVEQVLTQNAHIGSFMANSAAVSLMSEDGIATSGDTNVNELTADWENSTVILNEQANNLTVSGDVFQTAANGAAIPVLDQQEQTLGTWNIPAAASAVALFSEAPETPFNAGLTVEEADGAINVTVVDSTALASLAPTLTVPAANAYTAEVLFDKEAVEDVICANGSVTFPVTAGGTYTIAAKSVPGSLLIGNDFTLGFGSYHDEDQENPQLLVMQTRDDDNSGGWFDLDGEYEGYVPLHTIRVRAGRPSDSLGYYDEAEDVTIQVQKIRIEHLEGEENTFSFSPDGLVTEVTGQNDVQLYAMDGQSGRIRLWADVKLLVNGEELSETYTISGRMKFQPIMEENARYFESLEALEAYLHEPPQAFVNGTIYRLYLKSGKHKGTLTLPEKFGGPHIYLSGMPNGSTTIEGGIDLNNGSLISVSEISFVSPSGTDTKAIYNGGVGVISNCSFYNYDVALDSSSAGQVGALQGDLFVNNTVAVRADTAKATKISEAWMDKNTFINNETAIQVLSLHFAIGPFAYRVTNSNFINNGTDFDLDHAGSYFFYKNYFGKYTGSVKPGKSGNPAETDRSTLKLDKLLKARSLDSLNRVLESRHAIIDKADGVTATTNPRWAYPVIRWWHKDVLDEAAVFGGNTLVSEPSLFAEEAVEEAYVNYLTSDWDGTEILNEEAGNLQLDARAFGGNAEKAIEVVTVDRNTGAKTVIGTWNFDAAQPALLSEQTAGGTFHAGVTVKIGTGSATVTVEDSDVLRDLRPTFTVPAMLDSVQVVGPDDSVQEVHAVNNTLTARASCGGTYTILPYADLGIVENANGSIRVVVAEEFAGKRVLVASYDAFGKFLGLTPAIVEAGKAITSSPMEGADLLTVFLVESMQDMTPKTAAITHDVT